MIWRFMYNMGDILLRFYKCLIKQWLAELDMIKLWTFVKFSWKRDRLFLNINWTNFRQNHGKNKLCFDEMKMVSVLYQLDFYSVKFTHRWTTAPFWLKQLFLYVLLDPAWLTEKQQMLIFYSLVGFKHVIYIYSTRGENSLY
jgi:hypothetical protein